MFRCGILMNLNNSAKHRFFRISGRKLFLGTFRTILWKVSDEKLCSDKMCLFELFSAINHLKWSEMHQKPFTDRNSKKNMLH